MNPVLASVVGALVGAALGIMGNWVTKPKWAENHPGRVVAAVVALALVGAGVARLASTDPPPPLPQADSAPATASSGAADPTAAPSSESAEPPSSAPPEEKWLSELFVGLDEKSSTGLAYGQAYKTGGKQYGHAVGMVLGCWSDDGGDFWADYDVSDGYSRLQVSVGLRSDAPQDAEMPWKVLADGREIASGKARLGPTQDINVDVSGVTRLRLFMTDPDAFTPNECGKTWLVWGDPKVIK